MDKILEFTQFRTLTNAYCVKVTNDKIVLKVYALANMLLKQVWRREAHPDMFIDPMKTLHAIRAEPVDFFQKVKALHPDFEIPQLSLPKLDPDTRQKYIIDAFDELKPQIGVQNAEAQQFMCPITHDMYKEPVILNCGHTFEKEAIEEALKTKKECPLDRTPYKQMAPNFEIKNMLERWKKEDPIPTFSCFQEENLVLSGTHLQAAQASVEAGKYDQAITSYKTAFEYTKDWRAYEAVPELYKSSKDLKKECLACLYFAQQALGNDDALALRYLERAKDLKVNGSDHPLIPLNVALILFYLVREDSKKVADLLYETVKLRKEGMSLTLLSQLYYSQKKVDGNFVVAVVNKLDKNLDSHQFCSQAVVNSLNSDEGSSSLNNAHWFFNFAQKCVDSPIKRESHQLLLKQYLFIMMSSKYKKSFLSELFPEKLIKVIETIKNLKDKRQILKTLFQREEKSIWKQRIVDSYFAEKKWQKAFPMALELFGLYLKEKSYEPAKAIRDQIKGRVSVESEILWYQEFEKAFRDVGAEVSLLDMTLKDIWKKLGELYEKKDSLAEAEHLYGRALEQFKNDEFFLFRLGSVFAKQKNPEGSVGAFYAVAEIAISKENSQDLERCYQEIIKTNPLMTYLDPIQKINLISQRQILKLTGELNDARQEITEIKRRLEVVEKRKSKKRPLPDD